MVKELIRVLGTCCEGAWTNPWRTAFSLPKAGKDGQSRFFFFFPKRSKSAYLRRFLFKPRTMKQLLTGQPFGGLDGADWYPVHPYCRVADM